MDINIQITASEEQRTLLFRLRRDELAMAYLHIAYPAERNRTPFYMRRHGMIAGANAPLRSSAEPPKLPIPGHLLKMHLANELKSSYVPNAKGTANEPASFVIPISDIVANLMRPAFHRDGFGEHRIFHLEGEPIEEREYLCVCCVADSDDPAVLELRKVRFDVTRDAILTPDGRDMVSTGLRWAAAVVPLVTDGRALHVEEIAEADYDLRQVLGRTAESEIAAAYASWPSGWGSSVRGLVAAVEAGDGEFATFYHSALGICSDGSLIVLQTEATLADLAQKLVDLGAVSAGLLDSGGSCALYDCYLGSYLNHGWYFRESRGAVMVLETNIPQRLPRADPGCWITRRLR